MGTNDKDRDRDKEYDILWSKYSTAIAKAQDLQEQLMTKEKQWEKREEEFKIREKNTRDLCENILAKDSKEMVLGTDYSWSSVELNELILKSKRVFAEYVESRKDLMRKIMDKSEERRQTIESLEEQISILKTNPGVANISTEELAAQIDREKKEQKALEYMPQNIKSAVESGKATIVLEKSDEEDPYAEALLTQMADTNARMQITPKSVPVTQSKKNIENKKARREEAMKAHTINLKEYEDKMSEESWLILETIGSKGHSLYADIENSVIRENPTITSSKMRLCMNLLANMGIFRRESVINPLKGMLYIYQLTDVGTRLYKDHFNKKPVLSEMDIIMAEHDNCNHGYGIKFVAEIIRDSGLYKEVKDMNRKNPIDLGSGVSYVPDIICIDKNNVSTYIEYECVNHTQTSFNAKCSKMCKVTSVLNFIVPNKEKADKIITQIKSWIENRGAKSLGHITVRVATASQIKDKDLSQNQNWKYVFEPGKNKEPIVNF